MEIYTFQDAQQHSVLLSFTRHAFLQQPKHVLAICTKGDQWILTRHPERGLEFPGGKMEEGETAEEAALREIYEETGGRAVITDYLGEYLVQDDRGPFVKAIVHAEVLQLEQRESYMETNGPAVIEGDLSAMLGGEEFSFIMKDQVVPLAIHEWKNKGKRR